MTRSSTQESICSKSLGLSPNQGETRSCSCTTFFFLSFLGWTRISMAQEGSSRGLE